MANQTTEQMFRLKLKDRWDDTGKAASNYFSKLEEVRLEIGTEEDRALALEAFQEASVMFYGAADTLFWVIKNHAGQVNALHRGRDSGNA